MMSLRSSGLHFLIAFDEGRNPALYTLKRFDLFSPMCIILIDGKAKSKKADHGPNARAGQAIRQGGGRADGTGR
jgi:hypothetical protein